MTNHVQEDIGPNIESFIRHFCQTADRLESRISGWLDSWNLDKTGQYFEKQTKQIPIHSQTEIPNFDQFENILLADPIIDRHMYSMIGVPTYGSQLLDPHQVFFKLLATQPIVAARYQYSHESFVESWAQWTEFFEAETLTWKALAPMPVIDMSVLPISLTDNITIDLLTAQEVKKLNQIGLLQPIIPGLQTIDRKHAIGLRATIQLAKILFSPDEGSSEAKREKIQRMFGVIHPPGTQVILQDVLAVLRLVDAGEINSRGSASYVDSNVFGMGITYHNRPYQGLDIDKYFPTESHKAEISELWDVLCGGLLTRHNEVRASLHRFILALDRFDDQDKLVDLVIAAESLFLSDTSDHELKFRLALRVSKFIFFPDHTERQLFDLVSLAYDVRSSIVHRGEIGSASANKIPDGNISVFATQIESVLRMSLRKAITLAQNETSLNNPEYWKSLMFQD